MSRIFVQYIVDRFRLSDGRLVLLPDYPGSLVIDRSRFPLKCEVENSSGRVQEGKMQVALTHFHMPRSTNYDERWRNVIQLMDIEMEHVPPGSALYIFDELTAQSLIQGDQQIHRSLISALGDTHSSSEADKLRLEKCTFFGGGSDCWFDVNKSTEFRVHGGVTGLVR